MATGAAVGRLGASLSGNALRFSTRRVLLAPVGTFEAVVSPRVRFNLRGQATAGHLGRALGLVCSGHDISSSGKGDRLGLSTE